MGRLLGAGAVVAAVVAGLLWRAMHARSVADCDCPLDFPMGFVYEGKCFAWQEADAHARCDSRQNGFVLGGGVWCWDGRPMTSCRMRAVAGVTNALASWLPSQFAALQIRMLTFFMRRGLGDAGASAMACASQAGVLGGAGAATKPVEELQIAMVAAGAHHLAVQAMRNHPDDLAVQSSCFEFLAQTVAWNEHLATDVGEAGAQEVGLRYFDRFIHLASAQNAAGGMGLFMDPSVPNRRRFRELGGFHRFFEWIGRNYTGSLMCNLQNIVSTQLDGPEAPELLVSLGYLPATVAAMRDFRQHSCARGETVWNVANIFVARPEWADELYSLGIAQQVVELMRDEPEEFAAGRSLDPLGPGGKAGMTRIMHSSMRVLVGLALGNATRRDALLELGVFGEVARMLRRVGDLQYRAVWGTVFDVLATACYSLHAFLDADSAGAGSRTAALRESGVLDEVAVLLSGRHDTSGLQDCSSIVQLK